MKRVITILLLTLLICSTSISVFALPENEITVQIPVNMTAYFDANGKTIQQDLWYYSVNNDDVSPLTTGNVYYHAWNLLIDQNPYPYEYGELDELKYSVSLPGSGDVVIALPSSNVVYSKPAQDMSVTMGINILLNDSVVSFTKLNTENVSVPVYECDYYFGPGDLRVHAYDAQSLSLTYYLISDLSYGDVLSVKVGKHGLHEFFDSDNVKIGVGLPFGAFVSNYQGVDVFGSWIDPNASFSQNLDNISNTLQYAIDNTKYIDEKTFFISYANYQLNSLSASSDADYVQQGAILNSKLDNIITSMNNSAANVNGYRNALNQFSEAYIEALKTAETPEQGDYITTIYQIKQEQLTNNAVINSTHAVQRVIKQEDLDALTNLDNLESSMLSELSLQRLEDTVSYKVYFNRLDQAEAMTYRTIFDLFLNDAAWSYWIVIPMTFLIVSALLGTVIRLAGSASRSSSPGKSSTPRSSSKGG